MDKPLYECKGDRFEKIQVFKDKIVFINKNKRVELDLAEVCCVTGRMCEDRKCRLWIPYAEYENCILNIDREHQCHEIGDLTGISRQAISETEKRGGRRFIKKAKALRLPTKLEDWLVDKEPPIKETKTKNDI